MSIYLMCIATAGGMPIFSRKKGDCENLPFSTVASINGVKMFCSSKSVKLKSTHSSDDWTLIWKDFENSITLIIAGKGYTEKYLNYLIDLIFNTFLLFISIEDFRSLTNFDRMKREAKNYIPLVDQILETCESDLLNLSNCILLNENQQLLARLNEFSVQFGSQFCSIVINRKLAVATEGWWNLDVIDRKLLVVLSSMNSSQKDIPVYLPKKSPNTAYRFVTVSLTPHIILGLICGAEPPYNEISLLAEGIFKNDYEVIRTSEHILTRNLPDSIELDSNILGIMLVNKTLQKYSISRNIEQWSSGKHAVSGTHRLDILKTFYHQAVDRVDVFLNSKNLSKEVNNMIEAVESYWCSDYHKCHAYSDDDGNIICALYVASVPTYTMRLITEKTLSEILQCPYICW